MQTPFAFPFLYPPPRTSRDTKVLRSVPNKATGVIQTHYECFIDIPDKAGAINKVTELLSTKGINIKNLGIVGNREEREGALCLELYYAQDLEAAITLLQAEGYAVFRK